MRSNLDCPKNTDHKRLFTKKAVAYAAFFSISTIGVGTFSIIEEGTGYAVTIHTAAEQNSPLFPLVTTHSNVVTTSTQSITHSIAHKLIGAYQSFFHQAAITFSSITRPIGNTIFTVSSTISKIGSDIAASVIKIGTNIGHALGPVATKIGSNIGNGIKTVSSAIGTGISNVGSTLTTAANLIGLTVGGTWNPPAEILPSAEVLAHADGKVPVVLIHGAFSNDTSMINFYNSLENTGIPAYAVTVGKGHGILSTLFPMMNEAASVDTSAKEVADFVDKVQAETKSPKVDLVGYSEGGLITRDYLAHDPKDNVLASVTLGGIDHGTTSAGLTSILYALPQGLQNIITNIIGKVIGPSGPQLLAGSPFQQNLSTYPETKAGVHYLDIASRNDLVATPLQTGFLKTVPGADVTNIEVHSIPGVTANFDHLTFPSDPALIKKITDYIEEKGEPASAESTIVHDAKAIAPATPGVDLLH